MNLLLDTHVLLWWLDDHPTLSEQAKAAIADGKNMAFVSAAVIWEIRIKQALGKLEIPRNFRRVLDHQPFEFLDITVDHAHAVEGLPLHHRDPFDRMLVAQAVVEKLTLVTRDSRLKKYKIPLIEA
ncbi:MAG: type II toxin-antitoxin system VapC family toxin [Deltaproteobacteria bacterium]|nr:type II toxin-antitoxin system VapC family toxin [Deltaproteobacteria bacterium]